MAFDWSRFFQQYRVEFDAAGSNVSAGNVVVHCPFCGSADKGKHMSVNLKGRGWRCWRDPQHRGKNATRLVQGLIGCSWERAQQITGQTAYIPDDFLSRVKAQFNTPDVPTSRKLRLPHEFKPFSLEKPSARPYLNYLRDRGFTDKQIAVMTDRYQLYYCTRGPYAGRIVFTVWHDGKLISWTGRSIDARQELRYKTLSVHADRAEREGLKPALGAISHFLLWHDELMESVCDTLYLVEGPFDALKVAVLGRRFDIAATCFFTSSPTQSQVALLHNLTSQFKRKVLLLDRTAVAVALKTMPWLSGLGITLGFLPETLKDPGEFDRASFSDFVLDQKRRAA